jgi:hypothetical protein
MRKGVAERFTSEQWPASSLVTLTKDEGLFDALVAKLRESKRGRRVLKEAARSATGHRRNVILSD